MKLTFKNKWDFARGIRHYGKLWDKDGDCVFYDESFEAPFMFKSHCFDKSIKMASSWNKFDREWSTTEPLKHLDLVYAWDNVDTHSRVLGIYNRDCNSIFRSDGDRGRNWDNYEKFQGEWPKWAKEAVRNLQR